MIIINDVVTGTVNAIMNPNKICIRYNLKVLNFHITVRALLFVVLGRTKFWPEKPRIIEVRLYNEYESYVQIIKDASY